MDDATDLIDRLCTCAGMILEDVHPIAVVAGTGAAPAARIEALYKAATDVLALARAAAVIAARYT